MKGIFEVILMLLAFAGTDIDKEHFQTEETPDENL